MTPAPPVTTYKLPVLAPHPLENVWDTHFPGELSLRVHKAGFYRDMSLFLTRSPGSLGTAGTLSSPLRELTSNFPGSLQRGLLCFGLSEKF